MIPNSDMDAIGEENNRLRRELAKVRAESAAKLAEVQNELAARRKKKGPWPDWLLFIIVYAVSLAVVFGSTFLIVLGIRAGLR